MLGSAGLDGQRVGEARVDDIAPLIGAQVANLAANGEVLVSR